MSYPGNPSVAQDVRERIQETFEHAMKVAAEGGLEEARLGCDFILRLDPEFKPARRLADRLAGASGAVDVSDLRATDAVGGGVSPDATGTPVGSVEETSFAGLEDDGPSSDQLAVELELLLNQRRFEELVSRAQEQSAAIATDPGLQQIMAQAQERMEAAPYVENFLQQARTALDGGESAQAAGLIEKARALDASHPELAVLQGRLSEPAPDPPSTQPEMAPPVFEPAETAAAEPGGFSLEASSETFDSEDLSLDSEGLSLDDLDSGLDDLDSEEMGSLGGDLDGLESLDDLDDDSSLGEGGFSLDAEDDLSLEADEDTKPGTVEPSLDPAETQLVEIPSTLVGGPDEASFGELGDEMTLDDDLSLEGFDELPEELPELEAEPVAPDADSGPSDPDPRIAELLDEGQVAFDRGEFQDAIDAWSRIFLIDIDHEEAARRIDEARGQKAEEERLVEAAFHEGRTALENRDLEAAEAAFRRVVELQPNHPEATEILAKIDGGEGESLFEPDADAEAAQPEPELIPPPPMDPSENDDLEPRPSPRPRGESVAPEIPPPVPGGGRSRFLMIAGVVLALVVAGGAVLWLKWDSLFPNTEEPVVVQEVPELTPVQRAMAQYEDGKRSAAIAQLKRLPPASPHYQEAQALIADWEAEAAAEAGPTPEQLAERSDLIEQARIYSEEQRYWDAVPLLDRAGLIAPLEGEAAEERRSAAAMLEPFQKEISLLKDGEYDRSLRDLWLAREEDPSNPVVNHLLLSSYYNLGIRGLQQGRVDAALENFVEAQRLAPDDEQIARHVEFARTYEDQERDLLFRIYAKYLAPRPI